MRIQWTAILLLEIALAVTGSRVLEPMEAERNADPQSIYAVKSIQSEDGDVIECIDIYKQPAFNHPALRNHKIQMAPSYDPTETTSKTETTIGAPQQSKGTAVATQIWQRSGSCPDGTIPIRKMQKKNVQNASEVDNYARKKPRFFHHDKQSGDFNDAKFLQINHSLAMLHAEVFAYLGAKGDIKVWNPRVEFDDEYSTSQVALKTGPHDDYEAVESGWAVNPSVYGDRQTRFFVYWTVDGSRKTGCFDHTCPGFVQTSKEIALGAPIYPISSATGLPSIITLFIYKDAITSNWWVKYQDKINVGYWPAELFSSLRHHAVTVQWGGEVYSTRIGIQPHTATAMGNGAFPDVVFGNSGSIRTMRVLQNSGVIKFPDFVDAYSDEYRCYGVIYNYEYLPDPEFYYGGPGQNPECP